MKIPNPILLLQQLRDVEEDLLQTELPNEAGPLLVKRYRLLYMLVLAYRYGNIRNQEVVEVIAADTQAQQILEELDGIPTTPTRPNDAERSLVLKRGGVLSRLTKLVE